jgi:hypothetical protein
VSAIWENPEARRVLDSVTELFFVVDREYNILFLNRAALLPGRVTSAFWSWNKRLISCSRIALRSGGQPGHKRALRAWARPQPHSVFLFTTLGWSDLKPIADIQQFAARCASNRAANRGRYFFDSGEGVSLFETSC